MTPSSGNGPKPKIRHGPSTMLIALANQRTRIAIAASPAPRKTALIEEQQQHGAAAAEHDARERCRPSRTTSSLAPITRRSSAPKMAPIVPMATTTSTPSAIACTAARAAPSGSFSPMRRATVAVAPIDRPIATA